MQGHAYSVVAVKEIDGFKLVKLRNPWGSFEWKGNWSDNSPLWRQYPKVAKAVDFAAADDGMFWMDFKDFSQYYKVGRQPTLGTHTRLCSFWPGIGGQMGQFLPNINNLYPPAFSSFCQNLDFCFRTTGWDDISLDIHEESPICGCVAAWLDPHSACATISMPLPIALPPSLGRPGAASAAARPTGSAARAAALCSALTRSRALRTRPRVAARMRALDARLLGGRTKLNLTQQATLSLPRQRIGSGHLFSGSPFRKVIFI